MQTYLVIGHLQIVDLEVVVREFHEEDLRIYACFCGYSRVYVDQEEISGRRVRYGPDRDHLSQMEQVQKENMIVGLDTADDSC